MSLNGIIQGERCLKCHYLNDPGHKCQIRKNGCSIQSIGNCTRAEDKKNVRLVLTYAYMDELTKGNDTTKHHAILKGMGFDTSNGAEMYEFHHDDDKQVEFLQQREWTDAD